MGENLGENVEEAAARCKSESGALEVYPSTRVGSPAIRCVFPGLVEGLSLGISILLLHVLNAPLRTKGEVSGSRHVRKTRREENDQDELSQWSDMIIYRQEGAVKVSRCAGKRV